MNVYELGLRAAEGGGGGGGGSELKLRTSIERPAGVKCGTFGASPTVAHSHLAMGDLSGGLHIMWVDPMTRVI